MLTESTGAALRQLDHTARLAQRLVVSTGSTDQLALRGNTAHYDIEIARVQGPVKRLLIKALRVGLT